MTTEETKTDTVAETKKAKVADAPAAAAPAAMPVPTNSTAMARMDSEAFAMGLEPVGIDAAYRLAGVLAKAGVGGVKSADDALARLLAGRELGIPAMTSIRQLFVVEGKIGMEATLMHALCLRSTQICEYFDHVETTREQATFVTKRRGRPEKFHSFTAADAEAAGMFQRGEHKDKNNYDRWLKQMLEARCKAQLARLVYPDILGGIFTREELTTGVYDQPVDVETTSTVVADTGQAAVAQGKRGRRATNAGSVCCDSDTLRWRERGRGPYGLP